MILDFHVQNLLNEKMIRDVERGFTSKVVHQIRLWQSKALVSRIVTETFYNVKISYDVWEQKYAVVTETENRLTPNAETVETMCSQIRGLALADTARLETGARYYISIETTYQPISDETYRDLKDWVAGRPKPQTAPDKPRKSGRSGFLGVLMDLVGFGDKTLSLKSPDFLIQDSHRVVYVD